MRRLSSSCESESDRNTSSGPSRDASVSDALAGVDDLYTARAAIRQPAPAGCGVVAHRRLADVDDL